MGYVGQELVAHVLESVPSALNVSLQLVVGRSSAAISSPPNVADILIEMSCTELTPISFVTAAGILCLKIQPGHPLGQYCQFFDRLGNLPGQPPAS